MADLAAEWDKREQFDVQERALLPSFRLGMQSKARGFEFSPHPSFMIKDLAKKAVLRSGMLKLSAGRLGPNAAILMYHAVQADPSLHADLFGGIAHSEAVFRNQVELLAREFRPMSLSEVSEYIRGNGEMPKRSVVLTFDDGYADNTETARPILNQVGVPATFYATVSCIEEGILPWPSRLRYAFRSTSLSEWTDTENKRWTLRSPSEREQAYLASCDVCCKLSGRAQDAFVARVAKELETCESPEARGLMMSYDQLRALVRHGHMIGSHTMTHPNMAYVTSDEARNELTESKRLLELKLGVPIKHFSYPCPALSPHWNAETLAETGMAGYETAVTTDNGLVRRGNNLLCLKRIRPTKTVEGLRWNLECAFAGRAG